MRSSRGGIGQIVLWSGVSNAVLVSCFVLSANWQQLTGLIKDTMGHRTTQIERKSDPIAAARLKREDNEALTRGVQSTLKQSLAITLIAPGQSDLGRTGASNEGTATGDDGQVDFASYDNTPTAEETQGMRVAPVLRKDKVTGQLTIGNFKSMTFIGDAAECLDMGYSMLGDAGTSNDLLEVMTASDVITIAKICAKNGSVIISCRNDEITISPRKSRPDDKCSA